MKKSFKAFAALALTASMLSGCTAQPKAEPQGTPAPETEKQTEAATTAASTTASAATEAVTEAQKENSSKTDYAPVHLRIAYMPNMGSASAIIAARDGGFFDKVGITVDLVQFQGGPAEIAAMASGDIDISQIGHGAHALCIEGQAQIFGLDLFGKSDEVMANKEKGIEKIEDLKGKIVAVTAGTSSEIVLDLALQKAGMTRDDMELVEMDANGAVTAMVSGKVDACATWSPSTNIIRDKMGDNVVTLAGNADFFDQVAFPGSFIVTEAFAKDNHDAIVRFYAAILKAMDYRKDNIDEVCRWLAKEIEADPETIIATKDNYEWLTAKDVEEGLADDSIKKCYESQQQVFIDSERIKEKVPVDQYVMFDVMNEALELYKMLGN
ncbi:aliphatic sulfonate ABC transporter substrate-binding protein [Clostridium sp. chh4-2]|uniref:ABC transporter substrate-binding protein n=1 Tax=Clostridium sp. chh4-2 TaxID=2067550 RepID=UPI000CCDC555|nr:ABC transporter substrate-binding protein [Clostridium sp. chh4-2]PNV61039.1 aliphatic sulfonate ABC transporter substrate-binding protein [Clostridium sp. chh4-2]